jgi:glutamate--cysteine ligase
MRGADGGPWKSLCALPAFWVGLLYDQEALDAAWDLVADWTPAEHAALRDGVPRQALKTPFRGGTVDDLARRALALSEAGLKRRAIVGREELYETQYLAPALEIGETGRTRAEDLLAAYEGEWQGRLEPLFRDYAY